MYNAVLPFTNGMAAVRVGETTERNRPIRYQDSTQHRWGFVDVTGMLTVPAEYTRVGTFHNGVTWAVRPDDTSVLIHADGEEYFRFPTGSEAGAFNHMLNFNILGGTFFTSTHSNNEYLDVFRTQRELFEDGMMSGLADFTGFGVLPPSYRQIGGFSNGRAVIEHAGLRGVIDMDMNIIVEPRYNNIKPFSDGVAVVSTQQGSWEPPRYGIIDIHGNEILPISNNYVTIMPFNDGLAMFVKNIPFDNSFIQFGHNYSVSGDMHIFGFLNTLGVEVIAPTFLGARSFSEGLAAVNTPTGFERVTNELTHFTDWNLVWGFIDTTGRLIVDYQFDEVRDFREGLAAVAIRNEEGELVWGFIDTAGNIAVTPQFTWVNDFHEGYAVVNHGARMYHPPQLNSPMQGTQTIGGNNMLIDRWGRVVLDLSAYDAVGHVSEGKLAVNQGRRLSEGVGAKYVVDEGLWGFLRLVN
jgi:hypothetical protein